MDDWNKVYKELGEIKGMMNKGFTDMNNRLDVLNGSVAKHEKRLNARDIRDEDDDNHKETLEPILNLANWANTTRSVVLWLSGIILGIGAIVAGFIALIRSVV